MSDPAFLPLGEETFGEKLARARARSGLNLREVADFISESANFVSHSSIYRLEGLSAAPHDMKRRALACLAAMTYGYDPEELELSLEDLPRRLNIEVFIRAAADLRKPHNSCISATAGRAA